MAQTRRDSSGTQNDRRDAMAQGSGVLRGFRMTGVMLWPRQGGILRGLRISGVLMWCREGGCWRPTNDRRDGGQTGKDSSGPQNEIGGGRWKLTVSSGR